TLAIVHDLVEHLVRSLSFQCRLTDVQAFRYYFLIFLFHVAFCVLHFVVSFVPHRLVAFWSHAVLFDYWQVVFPFLKSLAALLSFLGNNRNCRDKRLNRSFLIRYVILLIY